MKVPIQYALTYPDHLIAEWDRLDLSNYNQLTFEPVNKQKFPCIQLAYDALEKGGTFPVVLNVANDEVVAAFLNNYIRFTDIPNLIEDALNQHEFIASPDLGAIIEISQWTSNYIYEEISAVA